MGCSVAPYGAADVGRLREPRAGALVLLHISARQTPKGTHEAGRWPSLFPDGHGNAVSQHLGAGRLDLCRTTRAGALGYCLAPLPGLREDGMRNPQSADRSLTVAVLIVASADRFLTVVVLIVAEKGES